MAYIKKGSRLNNSITVGELYDCLTRMIKRNPKVRNKAVFLTDDEEANGYHGCYYLPAEGKETVKELLEYTNTEDLAEEGDELILLG